MPRGPADRPIRATDGEVGLQAAMRRSLEQGAAPGVPVHPPDAERPSSGGRVAETAPARATSGVARQRGARSGAVPKPRKAGRAEREPIPDPRGRGSALDLRL